LMNIELFECSDNLIYILTEQLWLLCWEQSPEFGSAIRHTHV
jgi:hypothetical protein